jgi:chemotaxis protein CheZ
VLVRIGHMTRNLHDSLRGLGFDRLLERPPATCPTRVTAWNTWPA